MVYSKRSFFCFTFQSLRISVRPLHRPGRCTDPAAVDYLFTNNPSSTL
nr:MAG TPA: hypothetical protein [Caudoviricetes sp.]